VHERKAILELYYSTVHNNLPFCNLLQALATSKCLARVCLVINPFGSLLVAGKGYSIQTITNKYASLQPTMVQLFTFILLISALCDSLASASSSEISPYRSARALDQYGNSEQIQNAKKAATLYGTLVVAAFDTANNRTIVLSLRDRSHSTSFIASNDSPCMVQLIHKNPSFIISSSHHVAMICTGIKGDANWLVERVRAYSHRVWTRYNTFLDSSGAAYAVAQYMQRFWGYEDEDEEWAPSLLLEEMKRQDNPHIWTRPLGLVIMILSSQLPFIYVVEPSGIIQQYSAFAMGKYSNNVLEKLSQVINEEEGDLQGRLVKLIQSVVPSNKKDNVILIEILSETGVTRTVVQPQQEA
jgi:20S proteasome alpha/beta subunit